MRAVDFFCGAGGLTRGLLDAGVSVEAGIDADAACKKSYEQNNRPSVFYEKDVRELTGKDVLKVLTSKKTSDLLFAACAPCQPFSQHKNTAKAKENTQDNPLRVTPPVDATLLGAFARLVEDIRPAHVLIENVPGLARVKGFSTYKRFVSMLHANDYRIAEGVVDAKHYGVPQTRRRYVLIASRKFEPQIPARQFGVSLQPYKTVRQAISHFPRIKAGTEHPSIPNHVASALSELNLRRIKATPKDGGDRRSWNSKLELECHKGDYEGHTDVYGRMRWDFPSPTLTGKCHSLSNGRYGHPLQDRAISLREAASLQTFADSYVFFGPKRHVAQQIGNAVPVLLAEILGRQLIADAGTAQANFVHRGRRGSR